MITTSFSLHNTDLIELVCDCVGGYAALEQTEGCAVIGRPKRKDCIVEEEEEERNGVFTTF
ncbi:hypothetical protein L195_g061122, partial [Trifolium pratense]